MSLASSWIIGDSSRICRITERMKCIVAIKHLAPCLAQRRGQLLLVMLFSCCSGHIIKFKNRQNKPCAVRSQKVDDFGGSGDGCSGALVIYSFLTSTLLPWVGSVDKNSIELFP